MAYQKLLVLFPSWIKCYLMSDRFPMETPVTFFQYSLSYFVCQVLKRNIISMKIVEIIYCLETPSN